MKHFAGQLLLAAIMVVSFAAAAGMWLISPNMELGMRALCTLTIFAMTAFVCFVLTFLFASVFSPDPMGE
jgi:hypothetical protein